MQYLTAAFAGEGPTDHQFIRRLVQRHLEHVILAGSDKVVEIGGMLEVRPDGEFTNQCDKVMSGFVSQEIYADLLFVHTDAGSSVADALSTRVEPIRVAAAEQLTYPLQVVGVVPDRETEAWMIADIGAIESVLGLQSKHLPRQVAPKSVHTVLDPKAVLAELTKAVDSTSGRTRNVRRPTQRVERLFDSLANEVSFEVLREIPSFRVYEASVVKALKAVGILS